MEEPRKKRAKRSLISERISEDGFQRDFQKYWHSRAPFDGPDLKVISEPFRVCKISNFIKCESFMEDLKTELSAVKSRRESIDLYQFERTSDLAGAEGPNVRRLWQCFNGEVAAWMENNTRIELSGKMSMSSACYYDTDYLLCHDDNLGDRRIAFVLYLSKNWSSEDGGTLDLFETDENGAPAKVVRSLVPEYNSLVFFEVVENSYHQVAEVKSLEKSRWTINGWFHGPLKTPVDSVQPRKLPQDLALLRPLPSLSVRLDVWIENSYLEPANVKEIQRDVESKSYTFLPNYFKPEAYEKLSRELSSERISWKRVGPADVRNYEVARIAPGLPDVVRQFYDMFRAIDMLKVLKDYTELDLTPDETAGMDPKMCIELQRWSSGCYTLICDKSLEASGEKGHGGAGTAGESVTSDEENEDEDEEKKEAGRTRKRREKWPKIRLKTGEKNPKSDSEEDSEVSDIGDYLSDPFDCSLECSEDDREPGRSSVAPAGSLDLIVQFSTNKIGDEQTIDYVDPGERDGALIHVPSKDNHLCLVYKNLGTSRLHKYVNHYCKGYFYNLICTYYE